LASTAALLTLPSDLAPADAHVLLAAASGLARAREPLEIAEVVRGAARRLTAADGVTFVVREGDLVHYLDEEAIAPLWKGRRFPVASCVSGWAMTHRTPVAIEDVEGDGRIPQDLYRETFVRSLLMVPVRPEDPVAAIGAYWARRHAATARELRLVEALAGFAALALANHAAVSDLRRAVEARETFIGIASHELRTPLAVAYMSLFRARRGLEGGDPALVGDAVQRAGSSLARLERLVDTLLDVQRAGQGLELQREPVDLCALAARVVERWRNAHATPVELRCAGAAEGRWDPLLLEQAVENLVANAIKFGHGKPVDVDVDATAPGEVVLSVRDRGIGIAPEDQARIFDRFERAVSSRHFGGFGLGLWIVRRNVEAHRGAVRVESAPGRGATFSLRLPR
jgi:signal transduction histidine kinase